MPLLPPRSRALAVQENWLTSRPTDSEYLEVAFDYLDSVNGDYIEWKQRRGYTNPSFEAQADYQARAIRLAEAWRDLGWTRGDVLNFADMDPAERRRFASEMAVGRARRGGGDMPLSDEEAALFYHA